MLLAAGLLYMMYRRGWLKPPKLDYTRPDRQPGDPDYDRTDYRREDWAFLWTLILIVLTGYVLEAVRLVWLADKPELGVLVAPNGNGNTISRNSSMRSWCARHAGAPAARGSITGAPRTFRLRPCTRR